CVVGLGRLARRRFRPVAIHGHVAGGPIRALALLLEPHTPLTELALTGLARLAAVGELGRHLVEAHELAPLCLGTFTDRADRDPRAKRGDLRLELAHRRLIGPDGLAQLLDLLLQLTQLALAGQQRTFAIAAPLASAQPARRR